MCTKELLSPVPDGFMHLLLLHGGGMFGLRAQDTLTPETLNPEPLTLTPKP